MPRVALGLGENSIDRARITREENGSLSMQWFVRLPNGRLVRRTTRGKCSKGELRRRAHVKADELIALSGQSGAWKGSSSMSDYIMREAIPGVEAAGDSVLRPRTKKSYLRVLSLVADALKGFRIADAVRPRALEEALASIALSSGTATAEVSKTHRGRTIPVTDARIAERMRRRMEEAGDGAEALLFPAPASPGSVWDLANAEHALKKLYRELADELDIPLLHKVSTHVWRATLNTEWMQKGVPEVIRSAYFGHSPEVNRSYYTDTTNVSVLVDMLRQGKGESV